MSVFSDQIEIDTSKLWRGFNRGRPMLFGDGSGSMHIVEVDESKLMRLPSGEIIGVQPGTYAVTAQGAFPVQRRLNFCALGEGDGTYSWL